MRRGLYLFVLLFALGALSLWMSPTSFPVTTFQGIAMTVPYHISIAGLLTPQDKERVESTIDAVFGQINAVYNKWNPDAEISLINQAQAGTPLTLSPDLTVFFHEIDKIVTLTEGRFDPTIEPLMRLWKEHLKQGAAPSPKDITATSLCIGWNKAHLKDSTLVKDHASVQFDLGGIAKGLAVDNLTGALLRAGFPDLLVDWGGELKAAGRHPSGRPWTVFISYLGDPSASNALDIVPLEEAAIATSGDYLQYWIAEENGKSTRFSHIISPSTKRPIEWQAESIASVTILCNNCALADALATAAMLFPTVDSAEAWLDKLKETIPSLRYWVIPNPSASPIEQARR